MSVQSRRMLTSFGLLGLCLMVVGAVSRRHPAQAATERVLDPAVSTAVHGGVLATDGQVAMKVDLGQLSPLMGADLFVSPIEVSLPVVNRSATIVFHATPPEGETWQVDFWFRDAEGHEYMGGYTISRTSAEEEKVIPKMTIGPGEEYSAKVQPMGSSKVSELVIALQRIGSLTDPEPDRRYTLYGPETEWHVPLTPPETVSAN